MEFKEAQLKFIQAWGTLGSSWGINKTMGQIHALLLSSNEPLSTEDIMEILEISRGTANMNLRALMDWGIVNKEYKIGERRDFFTSEKDVWELAKQVSQERQKREIQPILKTLREIKDFEGEEKKDKEFKEVIENLEDFTLKASSMLNKFINSDEHWFYKNLMKLVK